MAGLTVSSLKRSVVSNKRFHTAKVQFDSSYPTGGESLTAKMLGMFTIESIQADSHGGYVFAYDYTNKKLQAYRTATVTPAGSISTSVTMTDGSMVTSYSISDLKGATNPAGTEGNADQGALPVNSALLMALALVSAGNTLTPTVQPDVPRNIMISIANDSGGALDLYEGTTTWLLTGMDINGAALTETVSLTSTAGNKSVANTPKYRYVQGVKPFATLTTAVCTNPPAATLKWSLGVGTRIGLPRALDAAAVADVLDLSINAARVAPGATVTAAGGVDTTNNAINSGTTADGDDFLAVFKTDYDGAAATASSAFTGSATTAAALAEVGAGVDLSAVYARVLAVGY